MPPPWPPTLTRTFALHDRSCDSFREQTPVYLLHDPRCSLGLQLDFSLRGGPGGRDRQLWPCVVLAPRYGNEQRRALRQRLVCRGWA